MIRLFQELLEDFVTAVGRQSARLEIRNGPEDGRVFPISTETVRIGRQIPGERSPGNEKVSTCVIRTDKAISREHCELTALSSSNFLLTDLDSRFGTELNGVRITAPMPCKHGDIITIGDTMLMLRTED